MTEQAGRRCVVTGTKARADAPDEVLVEGRRVFVLPRPELRDAYFGAVTDADGNAAPPSRPTDATALERD